MFRGWHPLLAGVFAIGSGYSLFVSALVPGLIGSHALFYTLSAGAMLNGGDPWAVGPPLAVFGGPPTMLVPFLPFAFVPEMVTRVAWVVGMLLVAAWSLRRLELPAYWLIFPPLFEAILLGHPEVLVLAGLVFAKRLGGLALLIKPYAVLPLLAERRWVAIGIGAVAAAATLPFLPWQRFLEQLPQIGATLARQDVGDSTFGEPVLMVIGAIALLLLGPRRALWLAVPVLWPYAQPIYKVMTVPMLTPVLALAWALPIPGLTLVGIVAYAVLVTAERRISLPSWLRSGIRPLARTEQPAASAAPLASTASAA